MQLKKWCYTIYMYVIVGLGNPEKKYEQTRHNVGFLVLDAFQKEHGFSEFTLSRKHTSLISKGILNETKILLAKPQTFMNNSGRAVKSLAATKPDLILVHDDIDIPLGKIKISKNRGSAGHKGIDSIIQSLGTKNFTRIRIGIQPTRGKPTNVEKFVLQKFSKQEIQTVKKVIKTATASLKTIIS